MTKKYQLTCLLSVKAGPAEREQTIGRISRLIQEGGGDILTASSPEERTLAYPVKKERGAVIAGLNFSYEGEKIPELQKTVSAEGLILRSLLMEVPEQKSYAPSARRSGAPASAEGEAKKIAEDDAAQKTSEKEQKVELKDIDKKIEEIFNRKKNELK